MKGILDGGDGDLDDERAAPGAVHLQQTGLGQLDEQVLF